MFYLIRRAIIGAPDACFRFAIYCSRWAKCLSHFYEFTGTKPVLFCRGATGPPMRLEYGTHTLTS